MLTNTKNLPKCRYVLEICCQILETSIRCFKKYLVPYLVYVYTLFAFTALLFWVVFWKVSLSFVWDYFLSPCCCLIEDWSINLFNSIRRALGYRPSISESDSIRGWQNRTHSMEGPPDRDYNMHAQCKLDIQHTAGKVQQVYCLPVMERERGVEGLLLVQVADTPCHYRRIGIFQCASSNVGDMGARRTVVLV